MPAAAGPGCSARLRFSDWRASGDRTKNGPAPDRHSGRTPLLSSTSGDRRLRLCSYLFLSSFDERRFPKHKKCSNDGYESLQLSKSFVIDAISNPRPVLTAANQFGVLQ